MPQMQITKKNLNIREIRFLVFSVMKAVIIIKITEKKPNMNRGNPLKHTKTLIYYTKNNRVKI